MVFTDLEQYLHVLSELENIVSRILTVFQDVFTFKPLVNVSVAELVYLYMKYTLLAVVFALLFSLIVGFPENKLEVNFGTIIVCVPIEEILFRGLPLMVLGVNGIILFHFIWAFLHIYIPAIVFAIIHSILEVRLWLGGYWYLAILIHLMHDLVVLSICKLQKRRKYTINRSYYLDYTI